MNKAFHVNFTKEYKRFVLKPKRQESQAVHKLSQKIEKATEKLKHDLLIHATEESEIEQIRDVNFSDRVLGDVKKFIAILLFSVLRFYMPVMNND